MIDMRPTIEPKTDQLNADSLIAGPITIKVTKVSLCKEPEQPIAINFEGDNGKPYRPGKSMRRVLVNVWGPDGAAYVGRSMTLYRDDAVKFGGLDVGGIRISHLSHITRPVTMALTASRAARKPFTVQPLVAVEEPKKRTVATFLDEIEAEFSAADSVAAVDALEARDDVHKALSTFRNGGLERLRGIIDGARTRLASAGEDDGLTDEAPAIENAPENASDWPGPDPDEMRRQREAAA
jgi:hypothetical protein